MVKHECVRRFFFDIQKNQSRKAMTQPDQLRSLLHQATPKSKRGKTENDTLATIIALSSESSLEGLFVAYKECRSQEPWMQKLIKSEKRFKTRESLLAKFRTACIEALTTPDRWCDLYVAVIWSRHTKISLQLCTTENMIMLLEDQGARTLTLFQPSSSSCRFSLIPSTPKDVTDTVGGAERMIRQCVRASRYTQGLDGATGKIFRQVTQALTQKKVTQDMIQEYVMNPATGRKVKIGSKTHKALRDAGMIN